MRWQEGYVQICHSPIPEPERSPDFGFMRKEEAERGRKLFAGRLMLMKQSGEAKKSAHSLQGMRFERVKAQIEQNGIKMSKEFILKALSHILGTFGDE